MSDSIYVSGIYNGKDTSPSHRARIAATNAVNAPGKTVAAGLDVRNATYYRRSVLEPGSGKCDLSTLVSCSNADRPLTIEQRWYAHRILASVMVMEVEILPDSSKDSKVEDRSLLAVLKLQNIPGNPASDFDFTTVRHRKNISVSQNIRT